MAENEGHGAKATITSRSAPEDVRTWLVWMGLDQEAITDDVVALAREKLANGDPAERVFQVLAHMGEVELRSALAPHRIDRLLRASGAFEKHTATDGRVLSRALLSRLFAECMHGADDETIAKMIREAVGAPIMFAKAEPQRAEPLPRFAFGSFGGHTFEVESATMKRLIRLIDGNLRPTNHYDVTVDVRSCSDGFAEIVSDEHATDHFGKLMVGGRAWQKAQISMCSWNAEKRSGRVTFAAHERNAAEIGPADPPERDGKSAELPIAATTRPKRIPAAPGVLKSEEQKVSVTVGGVTLPLERATISAVRLDTHALTVAPGITCTPGICGGRPCVAGTRQEIAGLRAFREDGYDDDKILAMYPAITREQLANVWRYLDRETAKRGFDIEIEPADRETIAAALRPSVLVYAAAIEEKLRENDREKGPWSEEDADDLCRMLGEEMSELVEAVEEKGAGHGTTDDVCREAADVGALAMMIAENEGDLGIWDAAKALGGPVKVRQREPGRDLDFKDLHQRHAALLDVIFKLARRDTAAALVAIEKLREASAAHRDLRNVAMAVDAPPGSAPWEPHTDEARELLQQDPLLAGMHQMDASPNDIIVELAKRDRTRAQQLMRKAETAPFSVPVAIRRASICAPHLRGLWEAIDAYANSTGRMADAARWIEIEVRRLTDKAAADVATDRDKAQREAMDALGAMADELDAARAESEARRQVIASHVCYSPEAAIREREELVGLLGQRQSETLVDAAKRLLREREEAERSRDREREIANQRAGLVDTKVELDEATAEIRVVRGALGAKDGQSLAGAARVLREALGAVDGEGCLHVAHRIAERLEAGDEETIAKAVERVMGDLAEAATDRDRLKRELDEAKRHHSAALLAASVTQHERPTPPSLADATDTEAMTARLAILSAGCDCGAKPGADCPHKQEITRAFPWPVRESGKIAVISTLFTLGPKDRALVAAGATIEVRTAAALDVVAQVGSVERFVQVRPPTWVPMSATTIHQVAQGRKKP